MKNHLCSSALILFAVFGCGGVATARCSEAEGCVCSQCPAGTQPSKACRCIQTPAEDSQCEPCPAGSFSDVLSAELCRPHTSCKKLGKKVTTPGTTASDAVCGDCLAGFYSIAADPTHSRCVKTAPRVRKVRTVGKGPSSAAGLVNSTVVRSAEEKSTEYAVFALVPVFCVMGLVGVLFCNILKKKGYNCTTEKERGDEEAPMPQKEGNTYPHIPDDLNEDTISVLVRLITEKKENAAALEELLLEYESKQMNKGSSIKFPMLSPLSTLCSLPKPCPHHSHLHTISGLSGLAPKHGYRCSRCAHRKWPAVLIPPLDTLKDTSKPPQTLHLPSLDTPADHQRIPLLKKACADTNPITAAADVPKPVGDKVDWSEAKERKEGEPGVLSVGRFQVAHIPEHPQVCTENKTSYVEYRNSMFGGKNPFSTSSSSSAFRR